jgi:hypothetical protein
MKIDKPGVYFDVPEEDYHGMLTPGPSLSKSMAHQLVATCPAKLWYNSYLNPAFERTEKKHFDIGHAYHIAVLEPDRWNDKVAILPFDDYRTNAAKAARDAAYNAGKIPLKGAEAEGVVAMRDTLMKDPMMARTFKGGSAEATVVAQHPETGIWLKARIDYLAEIGSRLTMVDLKSTGTSAAPEDFAKQAFEHGYFIQDPWYRMVYELATGRRVDDFIFVAQETEAPHLHSVDQLQGKDVEAGFQCIPWAIHTFAECYATGRWPGYATGFVTPISMPAWAHYRLNDQIGEGRFAVPAKPSAELLEFARRMQAPLDQPTLLEKAS